MVQPLKTPQITPKITLVDPNFTFPSPKSHKNPGVGGCVSRFGKDLPKKTDFFVGGSPYKSRQQNIAVTCLFVIWTVKLTALIVFRLRAKVSPSWTGRRSAPVLLSPPSPPSTSPTTASPPSRLSTASPPWRGEDYLSILYFFTSMLGWIEFYPCFFSFL